jgi:Ca-activated chloride channel family protein
MRKRLTMVATIAALALVAAACAGDDSSDTTSRASATTSPARIDQTSTTTGGGDRGSADRTTTTTAAANAAPGDTTFEDYGSNPFVDPARDGLSTFAVDVDTGAYTLMRAWVNDGLLPDPDSVRVEEYVNYFDAGYEAPIDEAFAIYADGGPTPFFDRRNDILRIGIQGREVPERRRRDLSLTFVIDVSGSMSDQGKLDTVKDSLAVLVNELDRFDTVSIVSYNTSARVELEPTPASETDQILDAIEDLRAGGSTNAEAGLLLGYDLADEAFMRDAVNRVVLLSDGVANVGNVGPEAILDEIGERAREGIDLVTVGVGIATYNDVLLEQLADQGNGWYAYVDTYGEAVRLFQDRLTTSLETIARDMKVQVEFDPDLVEEYRLIGFENRHIDDDDFRDDEVDAGEVNAGHSVTALYEVGLAREAYRSDKSFATVSVRWTDPDTGRVEEIFGEVTSNVLAGRFSRTAPEFQVVATVAAYAEVLRDSRYVEVDLDQVLDEALELPIRDLGDPAVEEFIDLLERAVRLAA